MLDKQYANAYEEIVVCPYFLLDSNYSYSYYI